MVLLNTQLLHMPLQAKVFNDDDCKLFPSAAAVRDVKIKCSQRKSSSVVTVLLLLATVDDDVLSPATKGAAAAVAGSECDPRQIPLSIGTTLDGYGQHLKTGSEVLISSS